MAGLAAGSLDRRVKLLRGGIVRNEDGDDVAGYAELATVWASVRPTPGAERLANAEAAATASSVVRIRWSSAVRDLSPQDQLEYPVGSGKMFNIVSVNEIGFREGIEIAAVGRAER